MGYSRRNFWLAIRRLRIHCQTYWQARWRSRVRHGQTRWPQVILRGCDSFPPHPRPLSPQRGEGSQIILAPMPWVVFGRVSLPSEFDALAVLLMARVD